MQDSELLARDSPLSVAESGCQKPNSIPKLRDFKYQLREQSITEADHFSNCTQSDYFRNKIQFLREFIRLIVFQFAIKLNLINSVCLRGGLREPLDLFKGNILGPGKMTLQLRALVGFVEHQCSLSKTHGLVHNNP